MSESGRDEWFKKFRAEWFREIRPMGSYVPWELQGHVDLPENDEPDTLRLDSLVGVAPQLRDEHLSECSVVPDRIALLERLPKGGIVAEVGTLQGEFARQILRVCRPDRLHLIDTVIHQRVRRMAADPELKGRIYVHQSDSVRALDSFPDEHFDWIYIDAQHGYDGVKRDVRAACSKVKADGHLVFNDYTVWSYVEMQPYGVVRAVNELCIEDGWRIVVLALPPHMYCDVALRRMK